MKVSFITTVLNEEKTIEGFLGSLLSQTIIPDEVIIVDGGSSDCTVKMIENEKIKFKNIKFVVVEGKNLNRSQGRNKAIKQATGELMAVSDAGCTLDKNWVEEIIKPFEKDKKVEVVAGYYLPTGESLFQKILGQLTSVSLEKINLTSFLPSSRSIAFKKSAWEKVDGYPENLDKNEDLVFAHKLKKSGLKFAFAPKAVVFWPQEENFFAAAQKLFRYSMGDGEAGQGSPHFQKLLIKSILLLFILILLSLRFFWILAVVFIFFFYKSVLIAKSVKNPWVFPLCLIVLPLLSLTVQAGFIWGLLRNEES